MDNYDQIFDNAVSRRRLTRIAMAVLDSPVLAEEVVQEAYLRLLEQREGAIEKAPNWLVTVTRNLALDLARRRMREQEHFLLLPGLSFFDQPDGQYVAERRLAELVSCLIHVSNSHVTAMVVLHVVFGISYEELAKFSGRSPAACRQAGRRALRRCFSVLNADEPFEESADVDMYVHAILDVSTAPLVECLNVPAPFSMQFLAANDSIDHNDSLPLTCTRTRQVLVLTADGVQWALMLDAMVLCTLGSACCAPSAIA